MADIWMDVDAALAEVPVNKLPLIDDTDFKTREESVAYNQAGLDLVWNFVTSAGAYTQTAVTPTTGGGNYDWTNEGNGMYAIKLPASGGASVNNDTEGYGWFVGYATGILPWCGPIVGFRDSDLNDKLCDSPWSATRGLSGTALPDAASDAPGGLPISDAGALDLDAVLSGNTPQTGDAYAIVNHVTYGNSALETLVDDLETNVGTLLTRLGTPSDLGSGASVAGNLVDIEGQTDDIASIPTNPILDTEDGSSFTSLPAVTLANVAHGGAAASITLADYSDFQGVASDPWSTALPGLYGVGTAGYLLGTNLDEAISGVPTAAENRAEMDSNSTQLAAIVADTNELQADDVPNLIAALNDLDAAGIRAAVGLAAANLDTQLGDLPTVAEFEARTLLSASYATAANQVAIEGKIDVVDGIVDAILLDTAEIGAAGAGLTALPWNVSWDSEVQSEVADALTAYGPNTVVPDAAGTAAGLIAALNDLDAADIRAAIGLTVADLDTQLAALPTAAEIVDEWESQSQLDPTGFYVNVREWLDSAVTKSATTGKPEVDTYSVSDDKLAADNLEAATEGLLLFDVNMKELNYNAGVVGSIEACFSGTVTDFDTLAGATFNSATDSLEALRNRGDSAWATNPLDAAGIRAAVGLASANLDTQLADLPTVAEFEARTLAAASYFDSAVDEVITDAASRTASQADVSALALESTLQTVDGLIDQIIAKLPSADYLLGTANADGSGYSTLAQSDILDDATPLDGSALNALAGHDPGSTLASQLDISELSIPTVGEIRTELETDGGKLDHLWEMTEDDGGVRRLTTNALEQAPTGAGGEVVNIHTEGINILVE